MSKGTRCNAPLFFFVRYYKPQLGNEKIAADALFRHELKLPLIKKKNKIRKLQFLMHL